MGFSMAVIQPTALGAGNASSSTKTYAWLNVTNADTCAALDLSQFPDRSIQITGTPNSATAVIQGSNDGTNYVTLNDLQGNALSFTATGLKGIAELVRYIRPSATGGGGSQSLNFYLHLGGYY